MLVNGRQVFPHASQVIHAEQRRELDGKVANEVPLGYVFEILPAVSPAGEEIGLYNVRFTVTDLDYHPVPLNTVVISLIKAPEEGELFILGIGIEGTVQDSVPWRQCRGKAGCLKDLLFNRIRGLLTSTKDRIADMSSKFYKPKGCHGRLHPHHVAKNEPMPHHGPPPPHYGPPPHEEDVPHAHGGHGPPHHHHWQHYFVKMVRFVVLPFVFGLVAGCIAIAVGTIVGHLISMLWQRHHRSAPNSPANRTEQGSHSEKEALMGEEEAFKNDEEDYD